MQKAVATGWSGLNIALHWLVVILVIVQWLEGDFMGHLWHAAKDNRPVGQTTAFLGYFHIVIGCVILAAVAARLADRWIAGRPPHPEGDPLWATWLSTAVHGLLYAILLLMPVLGLAAWFTGQQSLAHLHTFLWTPLLVLAGLHICGALVQHVVFKTPVLARMVPGLRPPS